jgi:dTDP-4-dehydrorhamnose 3,5-epimerase
MPSATTPARSDAVPSAVDPTTRGFHDRPYRVLDADGTIRYESPSTEKVLGYTLEDMLGRTLTLRQGNHSRSVPGALRGFHAEPWDKLVYVERGTAMAAVADIRPESATFGDVATFHLGDLPGERVRLFVAEGLANAYCAYGDEPADYLYDVSEEWFSTDKRSIAWNDPDLNVSWPVRSPILSPQDESNPTLRERFPSHPRFGR